MKQELEDKLIEIEAKLRAEGPIYIEGGSATSVKDFTIDFILLSETQETTNIDGTIQCLPNKNRSINDIYRASFTRFPELTFRDFLKAFLCEDHFKGEFTTTDITNMFRSITKHKGLLGSLWCPHICKRVFRTKNIFINFTGVRYKQLRVDDLGLTDDNYLEIRDTLQQETAQEEDREWEPYIVKSEEVKQNTQEVITVTHTSDVIPLSNSNKIDNKHLRESFNKQQENQYATRRNRNVSRSRIRFTTRRGI